MSWLNRKITKFNIPLWQVLASCLAALVLGGILGFAWSNTGKPANPSQSTPQPVASEPGNADTPQDQVGSATISPADSTSPSQTALIKVHFSKTPQSMDDPAYTQAADRSTTRPDVATAALEELIAGPTDFEKAAGMFTVIRLQGNSNCGSRDFSLKIEDGTATFRFCRQPMLGGDMDGFRVRSEIKNTLNQFASVKKIIILDPNGNCFDDLSGLNLCKF